MGKIGLEGAAGGDTVGIRKEKGTPEPCSLGVPKDYVGNQSDRVNCNWTGN